MFRWEKPFFSVFFLGIDTKVIRGAAPNGAKYYEVESDKIREIEGCYEKISFHSETDLYKNEKYPIYKQTDGQKDFFMKIDVNFYHAPWLITNKKENETIRYR